MIEAGYFVRGSCQLSAVSYQLHEFTPDSSEFAGLGEVVDELSPNRDRVLLADDRDAAQAVRAIAPASGPHEFAVDAKAGERDVNLDASAQVVAFPRHLQAADRHS